MRDNATSNPTLNMKRLEKLGVIGSSKPMTQTGAFRKTSILFLLMFASYMFTLFMELPFNMATFVILSLVTLGVVIFAVVSPHLSYILAPIYAILEGYILASATAFSEYILEAFVITAVIFFTLLFLYQSRIIRVSNGFVKLIVGLTLGIAVFYLIEMILIAFNVTNGSLVFGNGTIGLLIAAFCLFVAVSNLLIDFRVIEDGVNLHLPKYMEWYFGMGLLISIVWVYVEVLRFLSILNSDD